MSRSVSRSVTVSASPAEVFELLADPRRHPEIDGSGTVKGRVRGPARLSHGARFGMRMHYLVPYVITNQVVEFDEGRLIAWRHLGHHVWRYELEPAPGGGTVVTETFDWAPARSPRALELAGIPARNATSIERTLAGLQERFAGQRTA